MDRAEAEREQVRIPFPWVCATVIVGSIVLYALRFYAGQKWPPKTVAEHIALSLKFGALYKPSLQNGEWYRLITYAFAHGGTIHLLFNMLATSALGVPLERRIGTAKFLQLSLVACVGSAALAVVFGHEPPVPTVGASGMVFGWAGALLFLLRRAQMQELAKLLLLNAAISLLPGISWQGHLGGFLFALPCGFMLRRDPQRFSTRTPLLVALAVGLAVYGTFRT
jgi:rhomboid protease GluP